jgi:hypothetical protein
MRAYFFGNMYLSSIQQGIQAAHVVAEMFTKYPADSQQHAILEHWAVDHKTMVLLNAGYSDEIRSLITFFNTIGNPLPWAQFYEGKDSLDGALTCVGIILPEEFYEGAKEVREFAGPVGPMVSPIAKYFKMLQPGFEQELAVRLNNYGLAK